MKKVLLLIIITFFLTGCIRVSNSDYNTIINNALYNRNIKLNTKSRNGYSFYLPKGLKIKENKKNSLILTNEKYELYMYLDTISYYYKRSELYNKNDNAYYSIGIKKDDKFGYLEINEQQNKKYLVEIMYNYAKIEVIVEEIDLKEIVSLSISLLSSISYNDIVLENMISEDILNYSEEEFNIFEPISNKDLIEYDENSSFNDNEDDEVDTDLIE